MSAAKIRFERVSLEKLKKIFPGQIADGNENHNHNQKDKKKDKRNVVETRKPKAKA